MKLWVGVTDYRWFEFLKSRRPDEVNFWRPSGRNQFRAIDPGGLFLFKLHSPRDFIAGGGFLVRHSILPLSLAWEAFGEKNGAASMGAFAAAVGKYRADGHPNPQIGCTILTEPFFMEESDWIPVPANWKPNLVQGRAYDSTEPHGAALWAEVMTRLGKYAPQAEGDEAGAAEVPSYGAEYLARARLGQGAFRIEVTEAYHRRCALTGERTLPVLQAAHIRPFAEQGPHRVDNGLCLRSDLHILFDRGYLTVTGDHRIEVSRRIKEEWTNGRDYYALHGRPMAVLPDREVQRPSREFIEWHNEKIYAA